MICMFLMASPSPPCPLPIATFLLMFKLQTLNLRWWYVSATMRSSRVQLRASRLIKCSRLTHAQDLSNKGGMSGCQVLGLLDWILSIKSVLNSNLYNNILYYAI